MALTAADLEKIIIAEGSTGTVSPQHDDGDGTTTPTHLYDVYSFMATPGTDASGDGVITLSWQNPSSNFDGVLIRGSTDDYPDSIDDAADYTVYNGNGDTTTPLFFFTVDSKSSKKPYKIPIKKHLKVVINTGEFLKISLKYRRIPI